MKAHVYFAGRSTVTENIPYHMGAGRLVISKSRLSRRGPRGVRRSAGSEPRVQLTRSHRKIFSARCSTERKQ